jgi:hypothetical protein
VRAVLLIYAAGVAAGLIITDARPLARIGIALAWPIGPAAFVAVIAVLLVAALVIFPWFGAAVAAIGLGSWWYLGRV